ncbi:MAG: hypothetical protein M1541_16090 [Acidobacteria bacterium]|nr:hypothetical protein [Acidobacteriota bacterium]
MTGITLLFVCAIMAAQAPPVRQAATPTEMQRALEEFKTRTRALGLRSDSPRKQGSSRTAGAPWHGRIFENFRNDFLDAVPHQITQRGGTKSLLRRNQFGFNVAGPLVIPRLYQGNRRTYVSFSYEGVREREARSYLQTLPTEPERTGDFSAVVDQAGELLPIYDPATTRPNPGFNPAQPVTKDNLEYLRDPFPGNKIDAVRLDPVALKALGYYPSPNASAGPFARNNYFLTTPETNNADGLIVKVDHNLRTRHRISVSMNSTNGFTGAAALLPTAANPGPPDREYSGRHGSVEHVFTKSPRTVITSSFRAEIEVSTTGERDQHDYAGRIGLRGSNAQAFPAFNISPYVGMGRAHPQSRSTWAYYTWNNGVSRKIGNHSLEFSVRHSRYQVSGFQPAYPAGSFRFRDGLTSLPGIVDTGHGFASFLLGLAEYADKSYVVSPSYFRRYSTLLSAHEQYQAGKNLTLSLALSLNQNSPRVEKYDRQSTVDLSAINPVNGRPGAMIVAGRNGTGRAFQPQYVKAQPSASLAWNPLGDSKTVLRAAFSRSYDVPGIYASQWGTQAFNATPVYLSSNVQLEPAVRLGDGLPPLTRALPDFRPEAVNNTNADLIYRGRLQPVYQSSSLSVERQFPFSLVVTTGASYAGGRNLLVGNAAANLNAISLDALAYRDELNDEAFNRSLRPYPQYNGLNVGGTYPLGRYQREAAFLSLAKRATTGLDVSFRYDLSKQSDDYSGGRQNYFNRHNEWSLSYNSPQRVGVTYIYQLPILEAVFLRWLVAERLLLLLEW